MDERIESSFNIALSSPAVEQIRKALQIIENVEKKVYTLSGKKDEQLRATMKACTVLLLEVSSRATSGKFPNNYSSRDWLDISEAVSDYAVLCDEQQYSISMLTFYANCLIAMLDKSEGIISAEQATSIKQILNQVEENTNSLEKGNISEVVYIDSCLWILLEARIKMLSATLGSLVGEEKAELINAIGDLCFNVGRLKLYRYENQVLDDLLRYQKDVDAELAVQYDEYIELLEQQKKEFMSLIDGAFSTDFSERLSKTALLAESLGVKREETLDTIDKIDSFFE